MKSFKLLLSFIVLVAVAAAPSLVRAEDSPAPSASGSVKLTPEQESKIGELRKEEAKALKELRNDKKVNDTDKKTKAKAIKADFKAQIDAVKAGK